MVKFNCFFVFVVTFVDVGQLVKYNKKRERQSIYIIKQTIINIKK